MKSKDIARIAFLRLHNKNSKRIIIALAFGMIMIVPVVWLLFSFYYDFQSKIGGQQINNIIMVESNVTDTFDMRTSSALDFLASSGYQLTTSQFNEIKNDTAITWQKIIFNRINAASVIHDDMKCDFRLGERVLRSRDDTNTSFEIKFYEGDKSKTHPTEFDDYLMTNNGHKVIYGDSFSGGREIIVSEIFLDNVGLTKEEALNQNLSLTIQYNNVGYNDYGFVLDDDAIFDNNHIYNDASKKNIIKNVNGEISIFSEYRIVGIISREYYEINNLTRNDSHIWVQESALYTPDGKSTLPKVSVQNIHNGYGHSFQDCPILTYDDTDYVSASRRITDSGAFYPFLTGNTWSNLEYNNQYLPVRSSWITYHSYKETLAASKIINNLTNINSNGFQNKNFLAYSSEFISLSNMNESINIAMVILSIIGGITLFVVVVNYANIMSFNARKRANYMKMMQCMGISNTDKKRILWYEILLLLFISAIIALIVSGIIVLAVSEIVKSLLTATSALNNITLSFAFFPLAYIVVILAMTIIYTLIGAVVNNKKCD